MKTKWLKTEMLMMMKWFWHYCQWWVSSDAEPCYAVIREIYKNSTLDDTKQNRLKIGTAPKGENTE